MSLFKGVQTWLVGVVHGATPDTKFRTVKRLGNGQMALEKLAKSFDGPKPGSKDIDEGMAAAEALFNGD